MKRQQALELLGLEWCRTTLTEEIVKEAFRKTVRATHPDTEVAAIQRGKPPVDMDLLTIARDFLMINLDGSSDFACKLCQGLGSVPAKMGRRTCTACNGTGDKR